MVTLIYQIHDQLKIGASCPEQGHLVVSGSNKRCESLTVFGNSFCIVLPSSRVQLWLCLLCDIRYGT